MVAKPGAGEAWVSTFTQAIRTHLPKGKFILTHARTSLPSTQYDCDAASCVDERRDLFFWAAVAPWFQPKLCPGGGYLTVHKKVGDLIDWVRTHFPPLAYHVLSTCHAASLQYNIQFYNREPPSCMSMSVSCPTDTQCLPRVAQSRVRKLQHALPQRRWLVRVRDPRLGYPR